MLNLRLNFISLAMAVLVLPVAAKAQAPVAPKKVVFRGGFIPRFPAPNRASARYSDKFFIDVEHPARGIEVSDEDTQTAAGLFEPKRNVKILSINVITAGLPTAPVTEGGLGGLTGDNCLFARGPLDPMTDGVHCVSTYTAEGDRGYARKLTFPGETGLYVPSGTRVSCPVHFTAHGGTTIADSHVVGATIRCEIEYVEVDPRTTRVHKFLRIPYLDEFKPVDPSGAPTQLIAPDFPNQPWYRPWSADKPLKVVGLSVYLGPRTNNSDTIGADGICVFAIDDSGRERPRKKICMPAQTIRGGTTVSLLDSPVTIGEPFLVRADRGEALSARCEIQSRRGAADCIVYPLIEVPLNRVDDTHVSTLWRNEGYVDDSRGGFLAKYCSRIMQTDGFFGLTGAGKKILEAIWTNDGNRGPVDYRRACLHLFNTPRP